jgi:hypothetical protein
VNQVTTNEFSSNGVLPGTSGAFGLLIGRAKATWEIRMGQPLQIWKTEETARTDDRLWLSMLVDAMEQASRPELRAKPCNGPALAGLRAQLALPAPFRFASPSACGTKRSQPKYRKQPHAK